MHITDAPTCKPKRFLLVYGSETGQSQAIAEEIAEKAVEFGLEAALYCLDQTGKKFNIEKECCAVFITSTTGDGDPPANASKFIRLLKKRTLSNTYLSHLHYALLGLGDTNYSNFCRCARDLDTRLEQLGAKQFYPTGLADDGVGLEVVAEPWLEGLYPTLQKFMTETFAVDGPQNFMLSGCDLGSHSNSQMEPAVIEQFQALSSCDSKPFNEDETDCLVENSSALKDPIMNWVNNVDIDKSAADSPYRTGLNVQDGSHSLKEVNGGSTHYISYACYETACVKIDVNDFMDEGKCSLNTSSSLEGKNLTVPVLAPAFLTVDFSNETFETAILAHQNNRKLPSAASDILYPRVTSANVLTHEEAVKETLLLKLTLKEERPNLHPGDAISVVCPNNQSEIDLLLDRLNLSHLMDRKMTVGLIPDTRKRRAAVPPHIHPVTTLRYVFKHCVNIRDPPSKAFFRVLVESTSSETEVRRLQELCSKEGATEYTEWVRCKGISLLDVLYAFPSCQPPIERVLECLPCLLPRPYSICSYMDKNSDTFDIVFNVVEVPASVSDGHFYHRRGVCTGWLDDCTREFQNADTKLEFKLPIFLRTNQHFRPPSDLSKPIIMVGPGTGVAPFIGFLQQRASLKQRLADTDTYGEVWLFFGCRNRDRDFLFQKELEEFDKSGVLTRLCVSVSRDNTEPHRYVQDFIRAESESVARLMSDEEALIYVCGDAENMAKDVGTAFEETLVQARGMTPDDAHLSVMKKRLNRSYVEDVWS